MAFLHTLRKFSCNATVPNASFLVLVLVLSIFLATRHGSGQVKVFSASLLTSSRQELGDCHELQSLKDGVEKCLYLQTHTPCSPRGYIDYLRMFYCGFAGAPALGYVVFVLWLLVLFYLLGDTASEYFCASLEGLSAALRLPPVIAGVTLLSLGNGAPDVFASVVSFAAGGGESRDVGLNSVLGGALFVSTVVAGVVAVAVGSRGGATVERRGFVRDLCFLLLALCYVVVILLKGAVTVWAAAAFLSLYAAYVVLVWTTHCCDAAGKPPHDLAVPLLEDYPSLPSVSKPPAPRTHLHCILDTLQFPLYLPRRLTIPDIAEHRWSKPFAIASAALAPVLLAATWTSQRNPMSSSTHTLPVFLGGAAVGVLAAAAVAVTTDSAEPPRSRSRRVPWLAAGFLMSVLWAYMLARELVALLVAVGYIVGVKASILGVTVLAWGDSLGDLVSDVAMALHGGPGGAQTALTGCYAGPLFNTVVGLGLSLTLAAGVRYPDPLVIPTDGSAYETVGFLGAGLLWALLVLPMRGMRLDRVYGVGLLGIYLCFLSIRLCESLGWLKYSL